MTRCPQCGSAQTVKVAFDDRGRDKVIVLPRAQEHKLFPKYSKMYAYACTACGRIFDFTLENPENLAPFTGYDGNG